MPEEPKLPPVTAGGKACCPDCPPLFHRKRPEERVGVIIDIFESNYSGTSEDLAECPRCHKTFAISYKISEVTLYE